MKLITVDDLYTEYSTKYKKLANGRIIDPFGVFCDIISKHRGLLITDSTEEITLSRTVK